MFDKALSTLYDIYFAPSKIINDIKGHILTTNNICVEKVPNVRLTGTKIVDDSVVLKIQIINSRVSYSTHLSDVISDYEFISQCDQFSLIKIGYYSKIEETQRILNFKNQPKTKSLFFQMLLNKFKRTSENRMLTKDYLYSFLELLINDDEKSIRLLIPGVKSIFDVPFKDLTEDKSLLENIYPPDLLRIGYTLCQLESQKQHPPTFVI